MATGPLHGSTPAFGEADLSNCEREQIHLAGSIQPHGALLVVREPDLEVLQASANAASFIGFEGELIGSKLRSLSADLDARVREVAVAKHAITIPVAVRCHAGAGDRAFVGLVHRPPAGGLVVELERAGEPMNLATEIESALGAIASAPSIRALCDETARIFRALTGYDRVMVYRFDDDGHGEVFSEEKRQALEAFLGNRYPASDIPQIARRLYVRNRVRVLVDVHAAPVPIVPRLSPVTGADLDMSLCFIRTMSPIHIQYLKNMGVCATLVVSLMVGGRLWGLVSCHHYEPRSTQFEMRGVCELLAEVTGTRIAALESFTQSQAELSVRRLEQRMIEAIARHGDWRSALFDGSQSITKPVGATGAALLLDDQILTTGDVPSTQHLRELGRWLDDKGLQGAQGTGKLFATASLATDGPQFAALTSVASGVLATPISTMPGDYLVWFRPEQVRTVTWGGNPFKPVVVGDDPSDLSPRRSFSQWHQVVEGTSAPWSPAALTTARLIGATLTDVVIQFRSVRMLIAQDQLDMVGRQVKHSDQAVVIAGQDGRVFMMSQAFEAFLPPNHGELRRLEDLALLFAHPTTPLRRLRRLMDRNETWRGEADIVGPQGARRPVLVRADPVFSAPGKVLGFVVVLADMLERKAADVARRRFQEKIVAGTRLAGRLETDDDLLYQNLLGAVLENAQLAALEITDGVDAREMPALLESVQGSVDRSAELLRHLIRQVRPKG